MVEVAEDVTVQPEPEPTPDLIPAERRTDPTAYVEAAHRALNDLNAEKISGATYTRLNKGIIDACLANTGVSYEDAARVGQDRIASFIGIMEHSAAELEQVQAAFEKADDDRITEGLKKKWRILIQRTIRLQREARADPAKFMLYVGRDDDKEHAGEVFDLAACHLRYFSIWNDDTFPHSLTEAAVGHGKSTCLRYQAAWEVCDSPELRCLFITEDKIKASSTVMVLKAIIRSRRCRAVFPTIRVLSRTDKAKDSDLMFTVARLNVLARDATFFGAGIFSNIQGNRYDRIFGDDVCPEKVRDHPAERNRVNRKWFSVVEGRVADTYARIRLICTPWHPDDVAGITVRDVQNDRLKTWRVEIDRFRIKDDAEGKAVPIWKKWTVDYFEEQKIRAGINYDFRYRLLCHSNRARIIRQLHYYPHKGRVAKNLTSGGEKWLSLDPAGTGGKQSSDTGIVECVIYSNGYAFIPDCWFLHCPIGEVVDWVVDRVVHAGKAGQPYHGLHWEVQGGVKVFYSMLLSELRGRLKEKDYQHPLTIIDTGTRVGGASQNRGKTMRLKACSGYLDYGRVKFAGIAVKKPPDRYHKTARIVYEARRGSNIAKLADYILNFDGTRGTDAVDALTQWILYNQGRIKAIRERSRNAPAPAKSGDGKQVSMLAHLMREQLTKMFEATDDGDEAADEEFAFIAGRFGRQRSDVA